MCWLKTFLWLHVSLAVYCVICAVLDANHRLPSQMVPNLGVFCVLGISVVVFPLVAIGGILFFKPQRQVLVLGAHMLCSLVQGIALIEFIS